MRSLHLFLVLLTLSPVAKAQTLEESVCLMLEHEPELNAAEYDTLSLREQQKITRSARLPSISVNGSTGYSKRDRTQDGLLRSGDSLYQNQLGISLRQLLFDGGASKNQSKASRNAYISQQYLEKDMIERRVVDLAETYMDVIRNQRQVALAQRNVNNHRAMRDMLRERADAGGSRADVALVQGRLGLASSELATQKLAYNNSVSRFRRLCGQKPGQLHYPKLPPLPSKMQNVDLSNNYNYLAATEALEAAQHRARATESIDAPKFYLQAGASAGRDNVGIRGQDNETSALIVGSWDLFQGGANRATKQKEYYQVGKFEEMKRAADLERAYNLELMWQERAGSMNSIDALRRYADELSQVSGDYEEQFKIGRQELLNILDVQSEYFTASARLLDAEFNRDAGAFRVAGVQGRATEFILGKDGCEKCFGGKEPMLPSWDNAIDPDNRVPVTQGDLMSGRFESDGPEANYGSLHDRYYIEREQLPIEPQVDAKPKGKFFKLFQRKPRAPSIPEQAPIFK